MKKKEEIHVTLINKMLEKYDVDINYVIANPVIEGIDWYRYYTWTSEEEVAFKIWAISKIKKYFKRSEIFAKKEISMFLLNYGLMTKEK